MKSLDERIAEIQEEIKKTPYHKGTEHYIGRLKAKIARLKEERIEQVFKARGGGGGYAIRKTGDASVVLVGPPSVGKSTLLNQLTKAESQVGAYDFTTLSVIPGMLEYKGAKIQIFDVPGLISGAAEGKGRGKEVLAVARSADLILVMVDVKSLDKIPAIIKELESSGVRLNQKPPQVSINKKPSGGLKVNSTTALKLSFETIKSLAAEFRLNNAEITVKEDITLDRLVDAFMGNRAYLPFLVVINKSDLGEPKNLKNYLPAGTKPVLISAENNQNLEVLKERIWQSLGFIRIYLKKGEKIDWQEPLVVKKGRDLNWILANITIPGKENFKSAKVFGPGAKYPGQEVSLSFQPVDETVVAFLS